MNKIMRIGILLIIATFVISGLGMTASADNENNDPAGGMDEAGGGWCFGTEHDDPETGGIDEAGAGLCFGTDDDDSPCGGIDEGGAGWCF